MNDENTKDVDEKVVEDEKEKQEIILINEETIQSKIYIVRGQKVILDVESNASFEFYSEVRNVELRRIWKRKM